MPGSRVAPRWVLTERYEQEELGVLKSGKEAGVFLIKRTSTEDDRWCLLVRKDYVKRSDRTYNAPFRPGERAFRRDAYSAGSHIRDARTRRAVAKRTSYGRVAVEGIWHGREYPIMRRLWESGASVPYPVEEVENGLVMQYIGTWEGAAPRLVDAKLTREGLGTVFERLVENLRILAREGIAHGDLSAYNVLLWNGRPWIIDFPQAVDLYNNPHGFELFRRDVDHICDYFTRRGLARDPDRLADELLSSSTASSGRG